MALANPTTTDTQVTLIFNVDGRAAAIVRTVTVPACGSYVYSVHSDPDIGMPASTAYYRVVAYFSGPGFAQLIIRPLPTFEAPPILVPPQVIR